MSTVTKYADRNTVITTGWTNPTNAYADDGTNATAAPAKNAAITSEWGFPALTDGELPVGSMIDSVTFEFGWYVSTQDSIATLYSSTYNNDTLIGSETGDATEPLTETMGSIAFSTVPSESDIKTAGRLECRLRARRDSSNTAVTFNLDYVRMVVNYASNVYAQANAKIVLLNVKAYAQAAALISTTPQYTSVYDTFTRSVSPGWGTSSDAGAWESVSTSGWSVNGTKGLAAIGDIGQSQELTKLVLPAKWKLYFEWSIDVIPDTTLNIIIGDGLPSKLGGTKGKGAGIQIQNSGNILPLAGFGASNNVGSSMATYTAGQTWACEGFVYWNGSNVVHDVSIWNTASPGTVYTASQTSASTVDSLPGHIDFEVQSGATNSPVVSIDNLRLRRWTSEKVAQAQASITSASKTYPSTKTYDFVCGFEDATIETHWSLIGDSDSITLVTSNYRNGAKSVHFDEPSPEASTYAYKNYPSGATATGVYKFYVYFNALPNPSSDAPIAKFDGVSVWNAEIGIDTTNKFIYRPNPAGTGSKATSNVTVQTGRWYEIDCWADGTNKTAGWMIDGVAQTAPTMPSTTETFAKIIIGPMYGSSNSTTDYEIDDIAFSPSLSNYPIPRGYSSTETTTWMAGPTFAQAQAKIVYTYKSYAQAQASIKQTYPLKSYISSILADSPVVLFPMQESSGNIIDIIGNKTGTVSGSPTYGATGPIAGTTSIDIDANTQYFTVTDHADLDLDGYDATFEFWYARDTDAGTWQGIICKPGAYGVSIDTNDHIALTLPGTGIFCYASGSVPSDGSWHHYVLQRKDAASVTGDMRIFIDGIEKTLIYTNYTYDINDNNNNLIIGQDPESPIYPSLGKTAYIAIYKTFLTADEISLHYNQIAGPTFAQAQASIAKKAYLIVADKTSLTTTDTNVKNRMLASDLSVTVMSDEDAEQSVTGYALVVVAESVVGTTFGTKYKTIDIPVLLLDIGVPSNNLGLTTTSYGTIAGQTQIDVIDTSHPASASKTGTVTVFSSGVELRYVASSEWNTSAVGYLSALSQPTYYVGATYNQGDTLKDASLAPAKRAALTLYFEVYSANQTSNAWDFLDALISWALLPSGVVRFAQAMATLPGGGVTYRGYAQATASIKTTYPRINTYGFACGFEDDTIATHWSTSGTGHALVTDIVRNGTKAVEFTSTAANTIYKNIGSYSKWYAKFHVLFDTLPSSTSSFYIAKFNGIAVYDFRIGVNTSNQFYCYANNETQTYSNTIQTGIWYEIDFWVNGSNATCGWRVNGITQTSPTITGTESFNGPYFGPFAGIGGGTIDFRFDDILVLYDNGSVPSVQPPGFVVTDGTTWMASPTFAQTQAKITAKTTRYAQAQTTIKTTYSTFAQAQTKIKSTNQVYAQAQVRIKRVSFYSQNIVGDNAVAYWRLDEPSGNPFDFVGSNHVTTTYGTPTYSAAGALTDSNTAINLDGSTEQFTVPHAAPLNPTTNFSLEAWVYADSGPTGSSRHILNKGEGLGGGYYLSYNHDNDQFRFGNNTGAIYCTGSVGDSAWHHVVATYGASTDSSKIYIDGKDVTVPSSSGSFAGNTGVLYIGAANSSVYWDGSLDELAIYNNVLTPTQIWDHYTIGKIGALIRPAQAQTLIKTTYRNYAQSQVQVKATYRGYAQGQALIKTTYPRAFNYSQTVLNDSPVVYLRLNESSGITADNLGTGGSDYDGTYIDTPTLGAVGALVGDSDTAITLNGSSEWVTVPDGAALDMGDVFTWEIWFKRSRISSGVEVLLNKGSLTPSLGIDGQAGGNQNKIFWSKSNVGLGGYSTIAITDTTTWHHLVFTKNGSAASLWIDGADCTASYTNQTIENSSNVLYIGRDIAGLNFGGSTDEVAVYDYALSSTQIQAHYIAGTWNSTFAQSQATISAAAVVTYTVYAQAQALIKTTYPKPSNTYYNTIIADDPVAYWRLDEPSGTNYNDEIGSNDGTLYGSVTQGVTGLLTGDSNRAVTFGPESGNDDAIKVSSPTGFPLGGSTRSIEAWFKSSSTQDYMTIAAYGTAVDSDPTNFAVQLTTIGAENRIGVATNANYHNFGQGLIADGQIHHVVVVIESSTSIAVYLDGKLAEGTTNPQTTTALNTTLGAQGFHIGADALYGSGAWWSTFDGTIDEVAIYDYPLSAAQVATHYDVGKSLIYRPTFAQAQSKIKQTYRGHAQAQAQIKQTYPFTSITTYAQDSFTRSVSNGWGTADIGGAWTSSANPSWDSVDGSAAKIAVATGAVSEFLRLDSISVADVDQKITWSMDKIPTVANAAVHLFARRDSNNYYVNVRVYINPDDKGVTLNFRAFTSGGNYTLATETSSLGTYNVGDIWWLRFRVYGNKVYAKTWNSTSSEPTDWQTSANIIDGVPSTGSIGVWAWNSASIGNLPITYTYDNYLAQSPYDFPFGQAQAQIKSTYKVWAQGQAQIKQTYRGYAQSQAQIKTTYRGYAQAQTTIAISIVTYTAYAQAQALIKQTYLAYAQSQTNIKATYSGYAQSQAQIKQTYLVYAQSQASLQVQNNSYANAQAKIYIPIYLVPIADITTNGWVGVVI